MSRGVIAGLRDLLPIRPLVYGEALRIAEQQAARFLDLSGVASPVVPESIFTDLPKFEVNRMSPFPVSGATQWVRGIWQVVLNGAEPATRQKFSLAHELKHVIDHPFVDRLYASFPEHDRANMVERVCDYFAGCLLMPKPWVEREWHAGNQHLGDLAATFGVSQSAMHVRLRQIGLGVITPRCAVPGSVFSKQIYRRNSWSPKHHRSRAAVLH
jgi:hypothetical protein